MQIDKHCSYTLRNSFGTSNLSFITQSSVVSCPFEDIYSLCQVKPVFRICKIKFDLNVRWTTLEQVFSALKKEGGEVPEIHLAARHIQLSNYNFCCIDDFFQCNNG